MNCPNCGTPNNEGVMNCYNCGAPMPRPVYNYAPMPTATVPGKGLGIAGMVLGICSLVLWCFVYGAMAMAIVGAILSGVSISKAKAVGAKNGMAVAGLVCSIISLSFWIIIIAGGISLM